MSRRFIYPSLMGSTTDASLRKTDEQCNNSDLAIKEYDGYTNAALEVHSEFVGVANRELVNRELVNLENAAVNIDNSSDVIIGPVTQFNVNGNVTIYQNKDGQPIGFDDNVETPNGIYNVATTKNFFKKILKFNLREYLKTSTNWLTWLQKIFMCTILILCALLMLFGVTHENIEPFHKQTFTGNFNTNLENCTVYYRRDWHGIEPEKEEILRVPVGLVIIGQTGTKSCENFADCSKIVRTLQEYMIGSLGNLDLCENFLIAKNGDIYVARGWDIRNCYNKLSMGISFIGNYNKDIVTVQMFHSLNSLLRHGLAIHTLASDFIMVSNNQTDATFNPGSGVFALIRKYCNYSDIDLTPRPMFPNLQSLVSKMFNLKHRSKCIDIHIYPA